ncbi:hypothetical protein ACVOMV_31105 [Mesorhizobium atlanticum]
MEARKTLRKAAKIAGLLA